MQLAKPLTPFHSSYGVSVMGMNSTKWSSTGSLLSESSKTVSYAVIAEYSKSDSGPLCPHSSKRGRLARGIGITWAPGEHFGPVGRELQAQEADKEEELFNRVIIEYKCPKNVNDEHLNWLLES